MGASLVPKAEEGLPAKIEAQILMLRREIARPAGRTILSPWGELAALSARRHDLEEEVLAFWEG